MLVRFGPFVVPPPFFGSILLMTVGSSFISAVCELVKASVSFSSCFLEEESRESGSCLSGGCGVHMSSSSVGEKKVMKRMEGKYPSALYCGHRDERG